MRTAASPSRSARSNSFSPSSSIPSRCRWVAAADPPPSNRCLSNAPASVGVSRRDSSYRVNVRGLTPKGIRRLGLALLADQVP